MLNEEEITFLKKLFVDLSIGPRELKDMENNSKKQGETFWPKLYNFVIRYRSIVNSELDEMIEFWLFNVAPSCCYPKMTQNGSLEFICCFCDTRLKRTGALVRHYKEKHHEQIPKDIFGVNLLFFCHLCGTKYSRKEFYERHLESDLHKSKAENKSSSLSKDKKNHNKERKENEITEWENKRLKIETVSKDTELGSNLSDASETFTESELKREEGGTLFKDPSTLDPEIVHFDAALQCQIKSNDEILTISSGQIEIENSIKEKEGILRYDNISLFEF